MQPERTIEQIIASGQRAASRMTLTRGSRAPAGATRALNHSHWAVRTDTLSAGHPPWQASPVPIDLQNSRHLPRGGFLHVLQRHRNPIAARLDTHAPSRMVDDDLAHGDGGDREEMAAIMPARPGLIHEAHVRFMDEAGRVERVAGTSPAELSARDAPQVVAGEY